MKYVVSNKLNYFLTQIVGLLKVERMFKGYIILFFMVLLSMNLSVARAIDMATLDCVIKPFDIVEISSQVRGLLDTVEVRRGDMVKKGQVVAKLISGVEATGVKLAQAKADMNVSIMAKNARFELAKRTLKRVNDLFKKHLISSSEQDEAETTFLIAKYDKKEAYLQKRIAKLELEQATEILKLRSLKSPITGLVVERYKSPGEYIEEQPVMKIVQNDPLKIEVLAPISMFGKINDQMKAVIKPEQPIGGEYIARVTVVDRVIDAASATFGIRLEMPNPEYKTPSGLRCDVEFLKTQ